MKKSRFTEAQIVSILREVDGGTPVTELARKHGVHANTIRLWRDRYAGMETSDLVRLKQLEAENAQMQRIIARQTIEIDAMKNLVVKNGWGPSQRQEAVRALQAGGVSQRRRPRDLGMGSRHVVRLSQSYRLPFQTRLFSLATITPPNSAFSMQESQSDAHAARP